MKKKHDITIRSSAAEYLTFIGATGESGVEIIYSDENIWLTQKMIALLYNVETNTINYHLKKLFSTSELNENQVVRNFRITAADGKQYNALWRHDILNDNGKISAELAKLHAGTEFEKYRLIQDKTFKSDFDLFIEKKNLK